MKRFTKILKGTFLIIVIIVLGLALVVSSRQKLTYDGPYPNINASSDSSVIARGKHLVLGPAHCINCHHVGNPDSLADLGQDVPLSGAVAFNLPVGIIYSKNITPDSATGIGAFTDREIARALRYGIHPDGEAVYDFMPFHNMSDEDLTAVISYLRAQKPVRNLVPKNKLNLAGNVVKAFMVKPVGPTGEVPSRVAIDSTAQYGQYVATSVAECRGCHTMRDMAGRFTGPDFAGGYKMDEVFITPNLTPDSSGRIFGWSQQNFIDRFRMGKVIPNSPMPWNSFKRMSDSELKAIYRFLKSLKPVNMKKS